jgi:hypothetical protein
MDGNESEKVAPFTPSFASINLSTGGVNDEGF